MKVLILCVFGALAKRNQDKKPKDFTKVQCGECTKTNEEAEKAFSFNDDGAWEKNITGDGLVSNAKCVPKMISCRLGCYIKKDKGISTSIFEMGCIRMDDGKKNLKFTDKKSQLWKDINDLGKKGQLIKKCEEEMCYVCLEDNCNNDTEILAANFTKWYNDQTLIETTTALATTSTVSTLSLTTSGTIIKIPVQVKKISKDQNIPTTTAQTTTSNAQPKLISSTLITLLMLAGNCIFSEIL